MRKIILEIDRKLKPGEILFYDGNSVASVEIHQLLPDLKEAQDEIAGLKAELAETKQTIAALAKIVKEK